MIAKIPELKSDLESWIWEWALTQFYERFPTQEGVLDSALESDIRSGLLYVGVRFRSFNSSVGDLVINSYGFFILMFLFVVPVALLPSAIPFSDILSTALLAIAGLLLVISILLLGAANLLLFLYAASLFRFILQKLQPRFAESVNTGLTKYECEIMEDSGYTTTVAVYRDNFEAVVRFITYAIVCAVIAFFHFFSPLLATAVRKTVNISAIREISESSMFPEVSGIVTSLDALLPIDLLTLLDPESFPFLRILLFGIVFFSSFLSWKEVYQHSIKSQFEWSEYDRLEWNEEFHRSWTVAKIVMYHFLQGELQDEFQVIRGQVAAFPLFLLLDLVLSYIYLLLISGNV